MNTLILSLSLVVITLITSVHGFSAPKTERFDGGNITSLSISTLSRNLEFQNAWRLTERIHLPRNTSQWYITRTWTRTEIVDGSSRRKTQDSGGHNTKSNSRFTYGDTVESRNVWSSIEKKKSMSNTQDCDVTMITINPIHYSRNTIKRRNNERVHNVDLKLDIWRNTNLLEFIKNPDKLIIDLANKLVNPDLLEFIKNSKKNIVGSVKKLVNSELLEFIKNPKQKIDLAEKLVKSLLLQKGINVGHNLGGYLKLTSRILIYIVLFALKA